MQFRAIVVLKNIRAIGGAVGSELFFIVEHVENKNEASFLKFQFPSSIVWEELNKVSDGNILRERISYELFASPIRNYFIFDKSEQWGIYVGLEYDDPIRIIGYLDTIKDGIELMK